MVMQYPLTTHAQYQKYLSKTKIIDQYETFKIPFYCFNHLFIP